MKDYEIKAKIVIGTTKKVFGELKVLRGEPASFRDLEGSLKGKILVCPGEASKSVLEKARALGVSGIVCQRIDGEQIVRLSAELKTSWKPASFCLLVVEEEIDWDKLEGKTGTIEVEKKRLTVELT